MLLCWRLSAVGLSYIACTAERDFYGEVENNTGRATQQTEVIRRSCCITR